MSLLLETALFECGGVTYAPAGVLAATVVWGDDTAARSLAEGAACVARSRAEGVEVDGAALQALSVQFRRERGLKSAEATETWMATRGVTVEDFSAYLERAACADRYAEDLPDTLARFGAADVEDDPALWPEAVFLGVADQWCMDLAKRAAVAREYPDAAEDHATSQADLVEHVAQLERAWDQFRARVATEARLDQVMRARWQELYLIDCELAAFDTAAAAKEAAMCVREDGTPLEVVAKSARGAYRAGRMLLCDLPAEVRTLALCAEDGELLAPLEIEERHYLYRIAAKDEPRLDDAGVRDAVTAIVLDEAVRPLLPRHVQWNLSGTG